MAEKIAKYEIGDDGAKWSFAGFQGTECLEFERKLEEEMLKQGVRTEGKKVEMKQEGVRQATGTKQSVNG